ncbi:hypothetical protein Aperf_G00000057510 [Anoplocephala perfoliata]
MSHIYENREYPQFLLEVCSIVNEGSLRCALNHVQTLTGCQSFADTAMRNFSGQMVVVIRLTSGLHRNGNNTNFSVVAQYDKTYPSSVEKLLHSWNLICHRNFTQAIGPTIVDHTVTVRITAFSFFLHLSTLVMVNSNDIDDVDGVNDDDYESNIEANIYLPPLL